MVSVSVEWIIFIICRNPNITKPAFPVLFLKPTSSYITEGQDIVVSYLYSNKSIRRQQKYYISQIPSVLTNVFHEVELGVVISKHCRNVSVSDAYKYIGGYCLGLDLSAMCELVSIDDLKMVDGHITRTKQIFCIY